MKQYNINTLDNKLAYISAPLAGTKTITVLVVIKTGSKYESRRESGLSHFLEHMFFKGTIKRPTALALASELDSVGGEYNAFTSKEYTGYWIKVSSEKTEIALELVSDMLLNSTFPAEEIEREKGTIIEELNMYEDNPLMKIEDVFETCLYGDTPAGWDTIGTISNIKAFKRQDFIKYFERQYGTKSSTLIVAGNLPKNTNNLVKKYFSPFTKNAWKDKVKVRENQKTPALLKVVKKTDQVTLSLGVRTSAIGHKDEFIIKLLAIILGGSMSSRLFSEIRERRGLAYSVRTGTEFYSDSGYLTTTTGIKLNHEEEVVNLIIDAYKKVSTELVPEEELIRAKDMLKGRLAISLEASDDLANWYGRQAILRKKYITPEDYAEEINKITAADLRRIAKKIFVEHNLNLALIGPIDVKKEAVLRKALKL
ncbi:MAG: pitrilysin family protein [Candidatus Falkowbacteria bacterium]